MLRLLNKMKLYNRKKFLLLAICLSMLLFWLAACAPAQEPTETEAAGPRIVASVFPQYDWLRQIIGDNPGNVQLTLLLADGTDMHSYQPSVDDVVQLLSCDLFVGLGGESEQWVQEALRGSEVRQLSLLEILGEAAQAEETVEGMQQMGLFGGHEHAGHGHADELDEEYDEHVWLSLRNAETFCQALAAELARLDPSNAAVYEANAQAYLQQLADLEAEYQAVVQTAERRTLLFADRFPFRYLAEDYGLSYYAAFSGCYADAEASFATITFLAGKVDALGLDCVLTLEKSDGRLAGAVVQCTEAQNQQILALDSMQSVTLQDAAAGANYLDIMRANLATLRQALN